LAELGESPLELLLYSTVNKHLVYSYFTAWFFWKLVRYSSQIMSSLDFVVNRLFMKLSKNTSNIDVVSLNAVKIISVSIFLA